MTVSPTATTGGLAGVLHAGPGHNPVRSPDAGRRRRRRRAVGPGAPRQNAGAANLLKPSPISEWNTERSGRRGCPQSERLGNDQAWRWSYNARGIIEIPNRLLLARTAVVVRWCCFGRTHAGPRLQDLQCPSWMWTQLATHSLWCPCGNRPPRGSAISSHVSHQCDSTGCS